MCISGRKYTFSVLAIIWLLASATRVRSDNHNDTGGYYNQTCPKAPTIVKDSVHKIMQKNKDIVGGILRLQFHDCFITGCDASILLNSTDNTAEKDVLESSLRGFEEIDQIKAAVERECPGVVSCADILALATRDAVSEVGGKGWFVNLGRKDGMISNSSDPPLALPGSYMKFDQMVSTFAAKGFSAKEMITLSGAHSLGRAVCGLPPVQIRYYQFNGSLGSTDPAIDPEFAKSVKKQCPRDEKSRVDLPMDSTPDKFDNRFYQDVLAGRGLLVSDANLLTDPEGRDLVTRYAQSESAFHDDFAAVMEKMINERWKPHGEVRRVCYERNR